MSSLSRPRVAFLALLFLASCGGGHHGTHDDTDRAPAVVSTFLLEDVNPNSTTFLSEVSPRQHLARVSAWYFGHAT